MANYEAIKLVINTLNDDDFQWFCGKYLQDTGYDLIYSGPPQGRDGKCDHIVSKERVHFTVHCTVTKKPNLQSKIFGDIFCGACKSVISSMVYNSNIIYCSQNRFTNAGPTEHQFYETIISCLNDIDQLRALNFNIKRLYGDDIAGDLSRIRESCTSLVFIKDRLGAIFSVDIESTQPQAPPLPSKLHDTEEYLHLLVRFSSTSLRGIQEQHVLDILNFLHSNLIFRPELADKISKILNNLDELIKPLVALVTKLACFRDKEVSLLDLISFFNFMDNDLIKTVSEDDITPFLFLTRIIRRLAYGIPMLLGDQQVLRFLTELNHKQDSRYWSLMFTDLYLRHICGYIILPSPFAAFLKAIADSYNRDFATEPLAVIYTILCDPIKMARENDVPAFLATFHDLASQARTTLDARWIVSCFLRLAPLYDLSEADSDTEYSIDDLIDILPKRVLDKSPHLLFLSAAALLKRFINEKQSSLLLKYEKKFISIRDSLMIPQVARLQAEYAASLSTVIPSLSLGDIQDSQLVMCYYNQISPWSSRLFENADGPAHTKKIPLSITAYNETLIQWLDDYIKHIWRFQLEDEIRTNPFIILGMPALSRIYKYRGRMGKIVSDYIESLLSEETLLTPVFTARLFNLLQFSGKTEKEILIPKLLDLLDVDDQYLLLRHSRPICAALYFDIYYGRKSIACEALLLNKLLQLPIIGSGPKLYLAYLGGIKYLDSPGEQSFTKALLAEIEVLRHRCLDLDNLCKGQDIAVNAEISDCLISVIKEHSEISLMAASLYSDTTNPEIWNVIATTIYNNTNRDNANELYSIASSYSIAKCFARDRKMDDQKYCYNFIRCRSLGMLEGEVSSEELKYFVYDTVFNHLRNYGSQFFAYGPECLRPFFEMIKKHGSKLSSRDRERFQMCLMEKPWIARKYSSEINDAF
jgi:hypothetical protein